MRISNIYIFVLITAYSFSPWAGDLDSHKVGQKRVRENDSGEQNAKKPIKSPDQYCFDGNLEGVKSWLKILSMEENKENFIREQASNLVDSLNRGLRNFLSGEEQDETNKRSKIRDFSLIALLLIVNDIESRFEPEIVLELKKMLEEVAELKKPWKILNIPTSFDDYLMPEYLAELLQGKIEKDCISVIRYIISFLKKNHLPYQKELDYLLWSYIHNSTSQNLPAILLMLELGADPNCLDDPYLDLSLDERFNLTKKQIIFLLSSCYGATTNDESLQDKVSQVVNEITHNIPGWDFTSNYKTQSLNYFSKLIENTTILNDETLALIKACNKDKPQDNPEEFTRIFDRVKTLLDPGFYSSSGLLNFYYVLLCYAPKFEHFPQTADLTKFIGKNFPDDAFKIFLAALFLKNFDMAQLLIDSGAIDTNLRFPHLALEVLLNFQKFISYPSYHESLLHFALEKNYFWWVEFLAKNNFDVNLHRINGRTPLHIACSKNNLDSVKTLIAYNANPNIIYSGFTPMMLTTDLAILEFLKTKNVKCAKKDLKFPILKEPILKSNLEVLQFWKDYGFPFKNPGTKTTIFQFAIEQGWVKDEQTLEMLFDLSAENVNYQDKGGSSALMKACFSRDIKIVEWLIKAGADLDLKRESNNFSALHYAGTKPRGCLLKGYDKKIIALLIANNALVADDLTGDENFGVILKLKNQLLQAIRNNNIIELKYVLDQEEIGPHLALSKDVTGKHAIDIAADLGYEEIVQLLLKYYPQKPKIPSKSARK